MENDRQSSRSADLVALAQATSEDGSVDLTLYQARRLILRHQTMDGPDTSAIAKELADSPVIRTREGQEQIGPLLNAIREGLSTTHRERFERALDDLNIGENRFERYIERNFEEPVARMAERSGDSAEQAREEFSDDLADARLWAKSVVDNPDNSYLRRAAGTVLVSYLEDQQAQYGALQGAVSQGMNMLGDVVDLAKFGHRFNTDPHFRDMIIGAGLLYMEETSRDPMRPMRDVARMADDAWNQWNSDFAQSRREGKESEFLGKTGGMVGIELLSAVLPPLKLSKLGLLARALDGIDDLAPSPQSGMASRGTAAGGELVTEINGLVRTAHENGGNSALVADLFLNGRAGRRRNQDELRELVDDLHSSGDLDGLLKSGALTPRELGYVARHDISMFGGEVSFEQAVNAWARYHAKDGLTNRQTGELAEAIVVHQVVRDGSRDVTPIQNNSGHGNDVTAFNESGGWQTIEVKGSTTGSAARPSGDPFPLIVTRLQRADEARGSWDPKNVWEEAAAPTARRILDEAVDADTGRINIDSRSARVNIVRGEDGTLTWPQNIELEPWNARTTRLSDSRRDADYEKAFDVASTDGRWTGEQCRNIAGYTIFAMADNPTVRRADDIGMYNGQMFVSYLPHGKGVEPMFNAHIDPVQAAKVPEQESLQKAEQIDQQRAQTLNQQQELQPSGLSGPSIGARVA